MGGSVVTFTPGARTHGTRTRLARRFLFVGCRAHLLQGREPQVLNPGDTVNIPPDTMHRPAHSF
jgi:hypothetical protein